MKSWNESISGLAGLFFSLAIFQASMPLIGWTTNASSIKSEYEEKISRANKIFSKSRREKTIAKLKEELELNLIYERL